MKRKVIWLIDCSDGVNSLALLGKLGIAAGIPGAITQQTESRVLNDPRHANRISGSDQCAGRQIPQRDTTNPEYL